MLRVGLLQGSEHHSWHHRWTRVLAGHGSGAQGGQEGRGQADQCQKLQYLMRQSYRGQLRAGHAGSALPAGRRWPPALRLLQYNQLQEPAVGAARPQQRHMTHDTAETAQGAVSCCADPGFHLNVLSVSAFLRCRVAGSDQRCEASDRAHSTSGGLSFSLCNWFASQTWSLGRTHIKCDDPSQNPGDSPQ